MAGVALPSWATQKIGGLPAVAWGGIVVGVWFLIGRAGPSSSSADPNVDPTAIPEDPAIAVNDSAPTNLNYVAGFDNNDQWRAAAFSALVSLGVNAFKADRTLGKYLDSMRLDAGERLIVEKALLAVGTPPDPPALPLPGPGGSHGETAHHVDPAAGGGSDTAHHYTDPGLVHRLPDPSSGYRIYKRRPSGAH